MSLFEQILADQVAAQKAKDQERLSIIRMLSSALKNKKIELREELSEEVVLAVVKSQIKQLRDGLESFKSAGRDDLAKQAEFELSVLEKYMPAQMSDEELGNVVKSVLEEQGVTEMADMGKAMGAVMTQVKGQADGGRVKEMVQKLLG